MISILESKFKTTIVKVDRQTKIKKAIGLRAVEMAKELNAPEYKKYSKGRKLWQANKEKILRKYGPRARQYVMSHANEGL